MAQRIYQDSVMSQTLNNPDEHPPGGFRFFHKETQIWTTAPSYIELFPAVAKHRKASSLPPVSNEEVETQLCATMPPGVCSHQSPEHRRRAALIGRARIEQVNEFTSSLVRRWFGRGLVSQAQADANAAACAGCFYNQVPDGCSSCSSSLVDAAISLAIGTVGRTTKYDAKLKACLICKCHLRAKVWCHAEEIRAANPEMVEVMPDWCWV